MFKSKVLFIMTGSIACYKACQVISRLTQAGHEVQVVATNSALKFVGAATLEGLSGRPVVTDMYAGGTVMEHIHLVRWADKILVAPATANYINKIAQGVGDDLATTLFLAHDFTKPFFVAPAMNTSMYDHPITQQSMKRLNDLGLTFLDTATGTLACGEVGQGKLLDPDKILAALLDTKSVVQKQATSSLGKVATQTEQKPSGLRILVTAGGTVEPLDGVRVLGNLSTGSTGARLAEVLSELGCDVALLRATGAISPSSTFGIEQRTFTSFQSLQSELQKVLTENDFDVVVHAAAVSDFTVDTFEINGEKRSAESLFAGGSAKLSSSAPLTIHFKNTPKLVDQIKGWSRNKNTKLVAFKLTSHASEEERELAVKKLLSHAPADLVVQNDTDDIDKARKLHTFTLYKNGQKQVVDGVEALSAELFQSFVRSSL